MEITLTYKKATVLNKIVTQDLIVPRSFSTRLKPFEKRLVWLAIKLRIFYFACVILKKPSLIKHLFTKMLQLRKDVWGGDLKKLYKIDGKYYFNLYTPGWPSKAY